MGVTTAKLLARHFKDIDSLMNASLQDLLDVEMVGNVIAESIISYFHNEENLAIIQRLRDKGLQMSLSEEQTIGQTNILEMTCKEFCGSHTYETDSKGKDNTFEWHVS